MPSVTISERIQVQSKRWGRLTTTCAAHFTEHIYVGIIAVALPVMAAALGLSNSQAGVLIAVRSLVAGLSNIPSGLLADFRGKRSVTLGACLILLGLSSLLMSFAQGFGSLLVFMSVGAIGAGGFHPQSLSILSASYPKRRALALGVHDSSGNLGEILGPLTIGTVLALTGWRGTLLLWAIPGLAIGMLYAFFCTDTGNTVLTRKGFGRSLRRDILRNRAVLLIFAISVLRTMGQTALLPFLSFYLYRELGLSGQTVGFYMSALLLFAAFSPTFSGWLADRMGRRPLLLGGLAVSGLAIGVLPHLPGGMPLLAGLAIVGTALWALRPVIFATAMEVAPPEIAGTLVGFLYTGNMGLSFVSPIVAGIVADTYGYAWGLASVGIFPLLGCAFAMRQLVASRD